MENSHREHRIQESEYVWLYTHSSQGRLGEKLGTTIWRAKQFHFYASNLRNEQKSKCQEENSIVPPCSVSLLKEEVQLMYRARQAALRISCPGSLGTFRKNSNTNQDKKKAVSADMEDRGWGHLCRRG